MRVPGWARAPLASAVAPARPATRRVATPEPADGGLGSRAVSNTAVVLIARVLSRLAALVMVLVMARHLGDANYGRYTTLVAYSGLISIIADPGLSSLYTREGARAPAGMSHFLGTLLSAKVVLGAVSSAVFAVALQVAGLGDLIVPGIALLYMTTFATQLRNTFYAVGRLKFEAVAILGETAVQAGMIWWGAKHSAGVGFFVWAYAASYAFTTLYSVVAIVGFRLTSFRVRFNLRLFKAWLQMAAPFAFTMLLTNLYWRVDVPILGHFRGFEEVGWYQLAYKPFESLQFLPLAVQTVMYPLLGVYFRQQPEALGPAYGRVFKVLLVMGWPLTLGTFLLVHPIGRLFGLFPQSEPSLRILALGIVFLFLNSAFAAMLYATDRQRQFAIISGLAVVLNLVLNLATIPFQGYLAASANTVITEGALAIAAWWCLRRAGHPLPLFRVSWRILLAGVIMGLVLIPIVQVSFPIAVALGALAYGLALGALGAVRRDEVRLLLRGLGGGRAD